MGRKKMKNLQFAVLGLGIFGARMVRTLAKNGCMVLAVDSNPVRVDEVKEYATRCVLADVTDEHTLRDLDIASFDNVIIGIGGNMQASIMCTLLCKELGAPNITAKAINANHAAILNKLGVDRVIIPEADSADKAALLIAYPQISEMVQLKDDLCILEIDTPKAWYNKTIKELRIRERYEITVIFLLTQEGSQAPRGDSICPQDGTIVVAGAMDKLEILLSKLGEK